MPRRSEKNRNIEVILLQDDKHLWEKYHIVAVRPIFAKNVLLPQNLAVLADKANKNKYEQKMLAAQQAKAKKVDSLAELFQKIDHDGSLVLTRKTNKDGTLYAKVAVADLVSKIQEQYGIQVDEHLFKMKKKIQEIWNFTIPFTYENLQKELPVVIESEGGVEINQEVEVAVEEAVVEKTKEEIQAERDAKKAAEKAEKIAKLKEKYK